MIVPVRFLNETNLDSGHVDAYEIVALQIERQLAKVSGGAEVPIARVALRGGSSAIVLYEGDFKAEWEHRVECDTRSREARHKTVTS